MQVPSMQEMFDRAVRGLRSQGWKRCTVPKPDGDDINAPVEYCVYQRVLDDGSIIHCAWGWVDPEVTATVTREETVGTLREAGVGLAAFLKTGHDDDLLHDELRFASDLQWAHDGARPDASFGTMEERLREVGKKYNLIWPES